MKQKRLLEKKPSIIPVNSVLKIPYAQEDEFSRDLVVGMIITLNCGHSLEGGSPIFKIIGEAPNLIVIKLLINMSVKRLTNMIKVHLMVPDQIAKALIADAIKAISRPIPPKDTCRPPQTWYKL